MAPAFQNGDVVMLRGKGPIGWLVRHWTASPWAHCGVVYHFEGHPMLIDCAPKVGARMTGLVRYQPAAVLQAVAPQWTDEASQIVADHLGDTYSDVDAIRGGLALRPTSQGLECAEFAAMILRGLGHQIPAEAATPQSLGKVLLESGAYTLRMA